MNKHQPSPRPIGIDLFAGAGGLSLGFEQAGFDIAAAVELDPIHAAVHHFNFPQSKTICRSVCDLSGAEIRRLANLSGRTIDVVFGGAPCQGFSLIGKRALDDPRNELVGHFVRIVTELDAKYFVFENVKGLTIGAHKRMLEELIAELEARGYQVLAPFRVLNAKDYGVPQNRHRLFLMGCKRGLRLPSYPAERPEIAVWQAIGDLPNAEDFDELLTGDKVHAKYRKPSAYAARMRGQVVDADDYSYPREFDPKLLTSSMRTEHTELSRKRFAKTENGKTEPVSRFFKLPPDGRCNTLRAGTASDRGAFTSPRPIHPFEPRVITVREAARLHSYPDWFRLHSTKWHGFRQVGNSVPPLLARAVASEIRKAMGIKPTKPKRTLTLGDEQLLYIEMAGASRFFGVSPSTIAKRVRLVDRDLATKRYGTAAKEPRDSA